MSSSFFVRQFLNQIFMPICQANTYKLYPPIVLHCCIMHWFAIFALIPHMNNKKCFKVVHRHYHIADILDVTQWLLYQPYKLKSMVGKQLPGRLRVIARVNNSGGEDCFSHHISLFSQCAIITFPCSTSVNILHTPFKFYISLYKLLLITMDDKSHFQ